MTLNLQEPPAPIARLPRQSPFAFLAQLGPIIGLILIVIFFSVMNPDTFASFVNAQIMLKDTAVVATAALGMTMIIISGGIDLSVGSTIALTTVVLAMLLNAGCPSWLAAVGATCAAVVCGALTGALITQLRLAPFIVTLGTLGAFRGLAKGLAHNDMVRPTRDTWLTDVLRLLDADHKWMLVSGGVWATLVFAIVVAIVLRYTRFGRHIFAIGSNEQTARLCGIPVNRSKILIYAAAGIFTGLAGVFQFSKVTQGDPTTAMGMELDVIAAVVIGGASLNGGQGSVFGTIVGALLMVVIANGCTKIGMPNWTQQIITGAIIIVAATIDSFQHKRASR